MDASLAPDFRLRTPGGPSTPRRPHRRDLCDSGGSALVTLKNLEQSNLRRRCRRSSTGVQHAQLRFAGELLNDRAPRFADSSSARPTGPLQVRVALDLTAVAANL